MDNRGDETRAARFVAIDGIDGAGKSTQITRLVQFLEGEGITVEMVRDPGTTAAGEAIRELLLHGDFELDRRSEALLYMAARSALVDQRIEPALNAGKWVVSDRFLLANVVYQSVGGEISAETIWQLGAIATGGRQPDLTLLLDLPAEVGRERLSGPADRLESRGLPYMRAVREAFREQVPRSGTKYAIIDAQQTPDQVHRAMLTAVAPLLEASPRS